MTARNAADRQHAHGEQPYHEGSAEIGFLQQKSAYYAAYDHVRPEAHTRLLDAVLFLHQSKLRNITQTTLANSAG